MKKKYYVNRNAQDNGDHEVHIISCQWFPSLDNIQYLGEFESCFPAVLEAAKYLTRVNGWKYCCEPCHTS